MVETAHDRGRTVDRRHRDLGRGYLQGVPGIETEAARQRTGAEAQEQVQRAPIWGRLAARGRADGTHLHN